MSDEAVADAKPKKERSPNYPFVPLRKAVERAEALHSNHKKEAARLVAIAPSWNYGPKSSGLVQTVAALKQFGLIEDFGSGDDRKVQVTDLARRIIVDQRPGAREEALKEAARSPKLFGEFIEKWVPDRPSDAHCISELELDRGFNAESARAFLRIFDETIAFARLDEEAINSPAGIAATLAVDEVDDRPAPIPARRGLDLDLLVLPHHSRGPRTFAERLKVAIDGRTLAVTATLEAESEVDQLIAILTANKVLLPKTPSPPPASSTTSPSGAGDIDLD